MKTLEVKSLLSGIDSSIQTINDHQEQMTQIATDLKAFLSLEETFSGKGADSIKSFYEECHVPLLMYYDQLLVKFRRVLNGVKDEYKKVEPGESGFVSESFLNNELKTGLKTCKNNTIDIIDEVNKLSEEIKDIVSLPELNDDDVIAGIEYAQEKITKTIESLEDFDSSQTKEFKEIEEDITLLLNYINEIATMFIGGKISVNTSDLHKFKETESFTKLQEQMEKIDWGNIPVSSAPSILLDASAPISSVGNLYGTVSEGIALSETAYRVKKQNVNITKYNNGFQVKNGNYIDIKGRNYTNSYINSQLKLGNTPKIASHVSATAAVKTSFKSKMGVVGIAITAGENAVNNIESNATTSEVVGDAVVDVGLGAVTLAGGAAVVSTALAFGLPLLGAATVGFVASVGLSYLVEGIKVGKDEKNVSETIKDSLQSGIKTVAGWFK